MTRLSAPIILVAAVSAVSMTAAQEPIFRGTTHTVSLYATVVDQGGQLATGLTRDDFEIFDDGKPQPIEAFASEQQPITVVVMLDRSGSMAGNFTLVQRAAEVFVSDLGPDDRARVGSFSNRIRLDPQTFTSDRDELLRILHEELQPSGPTPLWNATSVALNALAQEQGRRVVLLFTDGKDTPTMGAHTSFSELRTRVETEETMVYAVGLWQECGDDSPIVSRTPGGALFQRRGPGRGGPIRPPIIRIPRPPAGPVRDPRRFPIPPPSSGSRTRPGGDCADAQPDPDLRQLAEVGGGGYFELKHTSDLNGTFARIADELHHQYLLAFTATNLDNRVHRLDVRLKQSGLHARARKSYVASQTIR